MSKVGNKKFTKKSILKYTSLTLIFILISISSLLIIFNKFGKNVSFSDIHIFSTQTIYQLLLLLLIFFTLDGLRLFYILKTLNIKLKFSYIIKLVFVNIFVCNITPFSAGGAFAQIYLMSKKGIPVGSAAAATTLRAIIASSFFIIITPFAVLISKGAIKINSNNNLLIYLASIVIIYSLFLYGLFKLLKHNSIIKKIVKSILSFFHRRGKITDTKYNKMCKTSFKQINIFSENFITFFSGKPHNIIMTFLITICHFFVLFTFSIILIKGLGYTFSALEIIANQIVVNFIMYFGFTPGASGFAEGGYTYMFSKFVNKIELISLTFYWRLFTVYIGSIIGAIIFYHEIFKNIKTKN